MGADYGTVQVRNPMGARRAPASWVWSPPPVGRAAGVARVCVGQGGDLAYTEAPCWVWGGQTRAGLLVNVKDSAVCLRSSGGPLRGW